MKDNAGKLYIFYAIAVIIIFAIIIFTANTCGKQSETKTVQEIEKIKAAPVTHYRDKEDIDHAQKQVAAGNETTINVLYNHILDSVLKHVNAKQKDLAAVLAVGTTTTNTVKPEITFIPVDTCITKIADSIKYHDEWIDIKGSLASDSLAYHIKDSLVFTAYWKRVKFLKQELFLDAYSLNKNTTVKGITAVDLQQAKPHKLGLDIMAGYSWNGKSFGITIGAGIAYRITK